MDSFNALVLKYQDKLFQHCFHLLGDPAAAEDAAQDSFIKAYQSIGAYRGGSFRAWLLKIATYTCYDLLRLAQRRPTQPLYPENENGDQLEDPDWLIDSAPSAQELVEQKEEARRVRHVLAELPEIYRTVLVMVDMYAMDYAEAAQALDVPVGTVRSRLARARAKMMEKLQQQPEARERICCSSSPEYLIV